MKLRIFPPFIVKIPIYDYSFTDNITVDYNFNLLGFKNCYFLSMCLKFFRMEQLHSACKVKNFSFLGKSYLHTLFISLLFHFLAHCAIASKFSIINLFCKQFAYYSHFLLVKIGNFFIQYKKLNNPFGLHTIQQIVQNQSCKTNCNYENYCFL